MTLSSRVNVLCWDLDGFERKFKSDRIPSAKFENEIQRLRCEMHRLHCDAHQLDEQVKNARSRSCVFDQQVHDLEHRIILMNNAIGFAKNQWTAFVELERNPPTCSSIFSSPSNSGASTPAGAGSSGYDFFMKRKKALVFNRNCNNPFATAPVAAASTFWASQPLFGWNSNPPIPNFQCQTSTNSPQPQPQGYCWGSGGNFNAPRNWNNQPFYDERQAMMQQRNFFNPQPTRGPALFFR